MDKEVNSLREQLKMSEAQVGSLSTKVDNKQLAVSRSQLVEQQTASQLQGVSAVQLQQLENMVDKYKKECEGKPWIW